MSLMSTLVSVKNGCSPILKYRINKTLDLLLENYNQNNHNGIQFAQILTIIDENIEDLSSELNRSENILAFTQTTTTHYRMLGIL